MSLLTCPEHLTILLAGLSTVRIIRLDTTEARVTRDQAICMVRLGGFHGRLHRSGRLRYLREADRRRPSPWQPEAKDGRAVVQPYAITGHYSFS